MFKGVLIPNWLNSSLASCLLINLDFLLLYKTYFDGRIILLLIVFETSFGFLILVFITSFGFSNHQYYNTINFCICFAPRAIWKYCNIFTLEILDYCKSFFLFFASLFHRFQSFCRVLSAFIVQCRLVGFSLFWCFRSV